MNLEQSGGLLLLRTAHVDAVDDEDLVSRYQLSVHVSHATFDLSPTTLRKHNRGDSIFSETT